MRSSRRPAGTPPAASQMRAAPDPRILTGRSGASPHVLRFPRGLSSGFPFARRVLPLRPPSSGFPSSGVLRFVSLRPLPGFRFPFGVPPGSLPSSKPHDSAAAGRFRRRWSRAARAKVTSPAATLRPDLAVIRSALQMVSGWARWDAATESPVTSGRERRTPPRPNRPDRFRCLRPVHHTQSSVCRAVFIVQVTRRLEQGKFQEFWLDPYCPGGLSHPV